MQIKASARRKPCSLFSPPMLHRQSERHKQYFYYEKLRRMHNVPNSEFSLGQSEVKQYYAYSVIDQYAG
jgi:hypothetical protein